MKSKILLLEDDLNLSETVCEYFEEQGFEVICVYNGDEAICAIYENSFDQGNDKPLKKRFWITL